MIAQIFFELRGIATLRITLTYHFLALCGAAIALAVGIPAEVKDMGWSKAISMVAMLAVIVGLLTHIILHQQTYEQDMTDFRRRRLERFQAGRPVN